MPPKGGKKRKLEPESDEKSTTKIDCKDKINTASANMLGGMHNLLTQKDWREALAPEFDKEYFKNLEEQINTELNSGVQVFPPKDLIFNALNRTPLNEVKVVLIGQDPYHDDGQAMGMAFSVPEGQKIPPSLRNMFTELETDILGFEAPSHGCLDKWADQGMLLLNATLTVQAHKPNSHSKFGWQRFTDNIIKEVSDRCQGVVFMLWGNFAHKKEKLIDLSKHTVLKDAHPSPLSISKYKGCKCFSRANEALIKNKKTPMNWKI